MKSTKSRPCNTVRLSHALLALLIGVGGSLHVRAQLPAQKPHDEVLYNGIRLPQPWPPAVTATNRSIPPLPPYLQTPPAVIPMDVGRQLFVDDFLIASTTLERQFHKAERYEGNPILKPETPIELNDGKLPSAAMISDGVCYDPQDQQFKLWYHGGWRDGTMLATSQDGLHWTRPALDVAAGTNRVLPSKERLVRHGTGIVRDPYTNDARQRFKMLIFEDDVGKTSAYISPDAVHWTFAGRLPECGDNATIFYNPFRQKWVFSIRVYHGGRARDYFESSAFLSGIHWEKSQQVFWAGTDEADLPDPGMMALLPAREDIEKEAARLKKPYEEVLKKQRAGYGDPTQLYNLDGIAYESLMLGVFGILRGPTSSAFWEKLKAVKLIDLELAYSRDGFHWYRPDRTPFLASTRKEGDWDKGYLHSGVGICTVVGDRLYFYYGGWSGISPAMGTSTYAGGATGVAFLRRDGFTSMDAGQRGGALTTRPITFKGKYPFVNVDAQQGRLRMEVLDAGGRVIAPFSADNCTAVQADSTRQRITWKGAEDLASLSGRPVRFRFELTSGKLYSFWVSPDLSGASYGYVAAGGPGFPGPIDTVGGITGSLPVGERHEYDRAARNVTRLKQSDVCLSCRMRSRGHSAEDAVRDWHPTRLEWSYIGETSFMEFVRGTGAEFVAALNTIQHDGPAEDAECLDGTRMVAPWMVGFRKGGGIGWACVNKPAVLADRIDRLKKLSSQGVRTIEFDDWQFNLSSYRWGGCFCRECRREFTRYLAQHATADDLRQTGRSSWDDFDYREYLKTKFGWTTPQQLVAGRKADPLDRHFRTFQLQSSRRFFERLLAATDPAVHLAVNANMHSLADNFLLDRLDYCVGETPFGDNERLWEIVHMLKLADALCLPQIVSPIPAKELTAVDVRSARRAIATVYALGHRMLVPWDVYWGSNPRWFGTPEQYGDLYRFVRESAAKLDGYRPWSDVVLTLPLSSDPGRFAKMSASARKYMRSLTEAGYLCRYAVYGDVGQVVHVPVYAHDFEKPAAVVVAIDSPHADSLDKCALEKIAAETSQAGSSLWITEQKPDAAAIGKVRTPDVQVDPAGLLVLPRIKPGDGAAPWVVHLINLGEPAAASVWLSRRIIGCQRATRAVLSQPGKKDISLPLHPADNGIRIDVGTIDIWAILELSGERRP
jgi:hypothetical protein